MLCIALPLNLQALVCEMRRHVLVSEIVLGRASPQVTVLVKENPEILRHHCPNSDIKLAILE